MTAQVPDTTPSAALPLPHHGHFVGDRPDIFGGSGYPLAVIWVEEHIDLGLHTHDFTELVLILGGSASHLMPGASYPISAGDAFVINPGIAHGYGQTNQLELVNILFDLKRLPLPLGELSRLPGYHALFELEPSFRHRHRFQSRLFLPPPMRRQISEWAEQLGAELKLKQDGYTFMSLALLMRIIGYLARAYTGMTAPESQTLLAVNRVISYIEHHYADQICLTDLAELARMCPRNLQRYFQRAFNVSPMEYVNRLRVKRACDLLIERDLTVTEVAGAVGLPDSNYFARLFRHLTGTSPSAYRASSKHLQQPIHPLDF